MSLNAFILDDENHAVELLTDFVTRTPGLIMAGFSTDPLQALEAISQLQPDLIFLDVDMPQISGLEFAGLVSQQINIIFTTAYREYAVEAFQKDAIDYLLKPIIYERFLLAVQRARKNRLTRSSVDEFQLSFFVKAGIKGQLVRIITSEIIYIESASNYVKIHLRDSCTTTYLTMTEIIEKLPDEKFCRIHKSFIINIDHIISIEYNHVKLFGITLPLGRNFKEPFLLKIESRLLISKKDRSV